MDNEKNEKIEIHGPDFIFPSLIMLIVLFYNFGENNFDLYDKIIELISK